MLELVSQQLAPPFLVQQSSTLFRLRVRVRVRVGVRVRVRLTLTLTLPRAAVLHALQA